MEKSVKQLLKGYLSSMSGRYVAGGVLEDYVRSVAGNKASCASRRLRELENEGVIEKKYEKIDGKGTSFVCYRIKGAVPVVSGYRTDVMSKQLQMRLI